MKRGYWIEFGAYALLFIICGFFFLPLFYPQNALITTPDFGTNDALYRSFATKYEYADALTHHALPLWTSKIGMGYPIAADAIGAWLPIVLLAFLALPPVIAYNTTLIGSVFLFGAGFYAFLRTIGISRLMSFFGGATIMLSGIIVPRLTHGMIIPALSCFPWLLLATHRYADTFDRKNAVFVTLTTAFLILANFPQASMLGIVFACAYYSFKIWNKPGMPLRFFLYVVLVIVALGIAGIQLVPTWEYLRLSSRSGGFDPESAVQYSFHPKNFLGFLHPFFIGNPKFGTYPPYWQLYGSIFWENSGFVGPVPLIFAIGAAFLLLVKKRFGRLTTSTYFFIGMTIAGVVLMVGKFSPLYIVFSFPPFSLFRTPSRLLWITVPSLILCSVIFADSILKRFAHRRIISITVSVLWGLNVCLLYSIWKPYHMFTDARTVLRTPEIAQYVQGRIYTIGVPNLHNNEFISNGWQHPDIFDFLTNGMQPNSTVFWNLSSIDVYGAVPLRRNAALTGYLSATITPDSNNIASISAVAQHILDMSEVGTVITPYTLVARSLTHIGTVSNGKLSIHAYRNTSALPRIRMAYTTTMVRTFEEAFRAFSNPDFDPKTTALVETPFEQFSQPQSSPMISFQESSNGSLHIQIQNNPTDGLLVFADTYYPGWRATVDDRETTIYPVNMSQRAIKLPKGSHAVTMKYEPKSFISGVTVTGISVALMMLITVFHPSASSVHTASRVWRRTSRHGNNPDT